jgi:hypothetical protein
MTDAKVESRVRIVETRPEHVPFVAWVELAAARSHLPRGAWDLYIDGTEAETLRFLEALVSTETWHWGHYRNFIVAEVDGTPAAALSGYFEAECGGPALTAGIAEANRKLGRSDEENAAGWQRAGSSPRSRSRTSPAPGSWSGSPPPPRSAGAASSTY